MRTLEDLNVNNVRRYADTTGRTLEPPPDISFVSGSAAADAYHVPGWFACPDKLAYQKGETEDNVLLELAEEKVLGCPSPHNSCFRRLHMDERIRLIRCQDPNFEHMAR